ncbi:hypothetical protein M422DRAFT_43174 [Sphaerobolus stellatus SS14]|nr:hypothetical protein M422DRAFT_43174 [Sphaerobolus stellatus SS14]
METFMDTVREIIGRAWRFQDMDSVANSLAMLQELKEVSHLYINRDPLRRGNGSTIISVWRYLSSSIQRQLDSAASGGFSATRNNPFELQESSRNDLRIWGAIIEWSTKEYVELARESHVKLDQYWLKELYYNVQYVEDLVYRWLNQPGDERNILGSGPVEDLSSFAQTLREALQNLKN